MQPVFLETPWDDHFLNHSSHPNLPKLWSMCHHRNLGKPLSYRKKQITKRLKPLHAVQVIIYTAYKFRTEVHVLQHVGRGQGLTLPNFWLYPVFNFMTRTKLNPPHSNRGKSSGAGQETIIIAKSKLQNYLHIIGHIATYPCIRLDSFLECDRSNLPKSYKRRSNVAVLFYIER